jgi:DNA mismatch repair protein MutL
MAQYQSEEKAQQLLLAPLVINVSHTIKNDTRELLDFLGNFGFQIEEFGPAAYLMKTVPVFMELKEAEDFIDYILDNVSEDADLKDQRKIDAIITNACKKAVKANDVLDMREIERLIASRKNEKSIFLSSRETKLMGWAYYFEVFVVLGGF